MQLRRTTSSVLAFVAAVGLALAGSAGAASALPAGEIGVFPSWATSGSSGAFSATPTFPASASFPPTTVSSTSTTVKAPTGESAWIGDSTGFGQEYGSSRSQPYLYLSTAAGQSNSVTTIDFAAAPPTGWGFALGDVDADWVFIQGWQDAAKTIPVTPAQLGFQAAGNYCNNVPKPSTCATGPFTDAPVWVTAPETFDGVNYVPGTLRGNSLPGNPAPSRDTAGAYGWFKPTVPIRSIDLTFGPRDGFPIYQLWMAAPAPTTTITGTVVLPDVPPGTPVPAGTLAHLNNADGTPVLNIEDAPVTAPVDPAGSYTFVTEQRAEYQIAVIPPAGYVAPAPITVAALAAAVTAPPMAITPIPAVPAPAAPATLPDTGANPLPWLIGAGALLLAGVVLLVLRRRRRSTE